MEKRSLEQSQLTNFSTGQVQISPVGVSVILLFIDMVSMLLAATITSSMHLLDTTSWQTGWVQYAVVGLLCILVFVYNDLYQNHPLAPEAELRKLTSSTTLVLTLIFIVFLVNNILNGQLPYLAIFWLCAVVLTPSFRQIARVTVIKKMHFGEPVIIFGNYAEAEKISQFLNLNPTIGFMPILVVSPQHPDVHTAANPGIPHTSLEKFTDHPSSKYGKIRTVILLNQNAKNAPPESTLATHLLAYERIIIVPDQTTPWGWSSSSSIDLHGLHAHEIQQNLRNPYLRSVKRFLDIALVVVGGSLILPYILLIALLIKITSPGPVLYQQSRVGKNGKIIMIWKFRTMVNNAEKHLEKLLNENPSMLSEWQTKQKLKNDPRITKIGRFLRKYSLDELPQIWNVLKGEMSLVGPRPCLENQLPLYGTTTQIYTSVQPGITGLWQVSGRNNTSYEERVRLDEQYVRNWSLWLDFIILLKTFWVVIKHDGAY